MPANTVPYTPKYRALCARQGKPLPPPPEMTRAEHLVRADELYLLAVELRRKALVMADAARAAKYLDRSEEISAKAVEHAAKAALMEAR